jgi:hypothetical protein
MTETVAKGSWARRLTTLALVLSLGGLAAALIAAVGAGQGAWDFRAGFAVLRYAFFAAIAGGVLALIALFLSRRPGGSKARALVALAASLAFVLYLGNQIRIARSVPAIHDIATNLDDLPQFGALKVRADNLEGVPGEDDPKLKGLPPEERWKALHREAYGDLKTVQLPWSVAETVTRARALAEERGWEIARADPAGILEATDTSMFFRFKDDVVLRARPAPGGGAQVDMRSISRVGGSDVGVNAKRIRAFLADLRKAAGA